MGKTELLKMLNVALELEHAARIQYLAHAKIVVGRDSDPIVARLKEIAGDELKHEGMLRDCIEILDGEPSMGIAKVFEAETTDEILKVNLKGEKDAVDFYRKIIEEVRKSREELPYQYEFIEHKVRHVIIDEEEHILEITNIL